MFASDLPLSRTVTDRAADRRGEADLLAVLLDDDRTRVLLVSGGRVVTRTRGRRRALAFFGPAEAALRAPSGSLEDRWAFLGHDDQDRVPGVAPDEVRPDLPAYVAHHVPEDASAALPAGHAWTSLREVGSELSARDAGLATAAVALFEWHVRHPRCPRCGEPTVPVQAGWVRRCPADGSEHYPRTDPAVIMAVVDDDDRLLLGSSAAWPAHRFSTLAGFVEAGESVEHAIRREVREETAVVVGDVEYRGSQPWPFPASLMLGFRARALSTDVVVDGEEIREARWFDREELRTAVESGAVVLPSGTSIARALIEDWFGGPLPEDPLGDPWGRGTAPAEQTERAVEADRVAAEAPAADAAEPSDGEPTPARGADAEPDPAREPAPQREGARQRKRERRSASTAEPGPTPEPGPTAEPEPTAEPASTAVPAATPEPEPTPDAAATPDTASTPEPTPDAAATPETASTPESTPDADPIPDPRPRRGRRAAPASDDTP